MVEAEFKDKDGEDRVVVKNIPEGVIYVAAGAGIVLLGVAVGFLLRGKDGGKVLEKGAEVTAKGLQMLA